MALNVEMVTLDCSDAANLGGIINRRNTYRAHRRVVEAPEVASATSGWLATGISVNARVTVSRQRPSRPQPGHRRSRVSGEQKMVVT
jgi:hypothetical protein